MRFEAEIINLLAGSHFGGVRSISWPFQPLVPFKAEGGIIATMNI